MLCHQTSTFTLEGSSDYQPEPTVCPASAIELPAIRSCHKMHSFSVLKQPAFRRMQCSATALLLIGLQAFTELLVFCTLIVSWGGICRKKSTGRLMLSPFHRLSCSQHISLKISQNACILHFVPLVNSCLKALFRPNKPILKHSGEKTQWRKSTVEKKHSGESPDYNNYY